MIEKLEVADLLERAWAERGRGNYNSARKLVEAARDITSDDEYNAIGRIYHIYMQFESDHGNKEKALAYCRQSVESYHQAGNQDKIAHSTRHLADLHRNLGEIGESERNYRIAIDIYRASRETTNGNLANALRGFALVLEAQGKTTEAIAVWSETRDLYQSCHLPIGVEEAQGHLDKLIAIEGN